MRWCYDSSNDVLYVQFTDEPVAATRELEDGSVADVDANGRLVGVEVLFGAHTWDWAHLIELFDMTEDEQGSVGVLVTSPLVWHSAATTASVDVELIPA